MDEIKPIGGFFELEVPLAGVGFHPDALALSTGRACVKWILDHEKPERVYLPFYTCNALYEPIEKMGIECVFYAIDAALDPVDLPVPGKGELLVLINYFGLKNATANKLEQQYGKRLVVDDTHRFFNRGYPNCYSFTSARKYFGVPDGAYLYGSSGPAREIPRNDTISVSHLVQRLIGNQEAAFRDYQQYEDSLDSELRRISELSESLLSSVDYVKAASIRRDNFNYLHEKLVKHNALSLNAVDIEVPFCYPLLPTVVTDKTLFHQQKIYVPTLWPDVLQRKVNGFEVEKALASRLLPLPVDQRYGRSEMDRIIKLVKEIAQ